MSDPEDATGFETLFVAAGVVNVLVELPVAVAPPLVADAVSEGEAESEGCSAAAMNGLVLVPPVPEVKSSENDVSELCCEMDAETSSVSKASPDLDAKIQLLSEEVKSIVPPFQLLQLSHRTLEIIEPSLAIPEPSIRVNWMLPSC